MGGSKPTPPTIIMPEESNPQAFQTIIPQKSYKDLAESMNRTEKEYNRLVDQRYDTVGTAAEMGKRNRGLDPPKPDIDPGTVSKVARRLDFIGNALGVSLYLSSGDPPLGKDER